MYPLAAGRTAGIRVCVVALLLGLSVAIRVSGDGSPALVGSSGDSLLSDESEDFDVSELVDELGGGAVPDTALGRQYHNLKSKMLVVTAKDLEDAVTRAAAHTGVPARELAELVYHASQYGNLQSLNNLLTELVDPRNAIFIDQKTAGLGDVLRYLAAKNKMPNRQHHGMDPQDFFLVCPFDVAEFDKKKLMLGNKDQYIIVLDTVLIRKASANTPAGRGLRKNLMELSQHEKVKLLAPLGWGTGINVFNQLEYQDTIGRLAKELKAMRARAFLIEEHEHAYLEDIYGESYGKMEPGLQALAEKHMLFTRILMSDVRSKLEEWANAEGLAEVPDVMVRFRLRMDSKEYRLITAHEDSFDASDSEYEDSESSMEDSNELLCFYTEMELAPKMPTFREYREAVQTAAGCQTEDEIAAGLERDGYFLSMNNLAKMSRDIRVEMLENDFVPDLYFIPGTEAKSYTMATMIHLMVNKLDPWKVQNLAGTEEVALGRADQGLRTKVLILDDYAGSGDSLMAETMLPMSETRWASGTVDVAVAPLLQSAVATEVFSSGLGGGGALRTFPGRMINSVTSRGETPPPWMGGPGYGDGFYMVALPYMSPDNNCYFAQWVVAPLFVATAHGVKQDKDAYPPICSTEGRLEVFLKNSAWDSAIAAEVIRLAPPVCTEFAFQFYCKDANRAKSSRTFAPDVDMSLARVAKAMAEGGWENGFEDSAKPSSPECVMDALGVLVEKGIFKSQGGSAVKLGKFRGSCGMLNYNPEWTGWEHQARYLKESARDAGLFGFEWKDFPPPYWAKA